MVVYELPGADAAVEVPVTLPAAEDDVAQKKGKGAGQDPKGDEDAADAGLLQVDMRLMDAFALLLRGLKLELVVEQPVKPPSADEADGETAEKAAGAEGEGGEAGGEQGASQLERVVVGEALVRLVPVLEGETLAHSEEVTFRSLAPLVDETGKFLSLEESEGFRQVAGRCKLALALHAPPEPAEGEEA